MASLVFVLCELVKQVLHLISCSQNMTLAFVKNAIHATVLIRKFTHYFVKFIFFFKQKRLFMSFR